MQSSRNPHARGALRRWLPDPERSYRTKRPQNLWDVVAEPCGAYAVRGCVRPHVCRRKWSTSTSKTGCSICAQAGIVTATSLTRWSSRRASRGSRFVDRLELARQTHARDTARGGTLLHAVDLASRGSDESDQTPALSCRGQRIWKDASHAVSTTSICVRS